MNKHVLIFSYWFPPVNVIGASRPAGMAQYFARQGWKVTVVSGASRAASRDFMPDISGVRVVSVDDTRITEFGNFSQGRGKVQRHLSAGLRLLSYPDIFSSVVKKMVEAARKVIIDRGVPDVIISSALPFSCHVGASKLAVEFGLLFVADNRDTWAHNSYRRTFPAYAPFEQGFELSVFKSADLVSTISEGMSKWYRRKYPEIAKKVITIRNGVDRSITEDEARQYLKNSHARKNLNLVYTGILYGNRRDISPLLRAAELSGLDICVDFFGSEPDEVDRLVQRFKKIKIVNRGRVSREESLKAQRLSDALVVVLGSDEAENTFLPGKFFEYVGSGRPIIGLANSESELSYLIKTFDLGIATRNQNEILDFLISCIPGKTVSRSSVPLEFDRSYQIAKLENKIAALLLN